MKLEADQPRCTTFALATTNGVNGCNSAREECLRQGTVVNPVPCRLDEATADGIEACKSLDTAALTACYEQSVGELLALTCEDGREGFAAAAACILEQRDRGSYSPE